MSDPEVRVQDQKNAYKELIKTAIVYPFLWTGVSSDYINSSYNAEPSEDRDLNIGHSFHTLR